MNLKFSPIKILIFLSFFISITNAYTYHGVLSRTLPPSDFKSSSQVTLLGTGYIKYNNKIYSYTPNNIEAFNAEKSKYTSNSYFRFNGDVPSDIILISPREDTLYCQDINNHEKYNWSTTDCLNPGEGPATYSGYFWTKVKIGYYAASVLTYVTTCKANENFNTQTQKCEAPCVKGQSWDQENNKCYIDCTDKNSNKWGFPDGSCIDCSGEKTPAGVMTCYCKYFGVKPNGYDQPGFGTGFIKIPGLYPEGFDGAECEGGIGFVYKDPRADPVETDNNKTEEPGGGSKNPDSNSTNSGNKGDNSKDKDGNKTSPKDPSTPNQNGNQTATPANPVDPNGGSNGGGSNSGSGGGSNGGSNNNGSSGGGTTIIDNGGSGSGKGNDKSDFDGLKYNLDDFRLDDIESDVKGFSDSILKRYDEFMVNFSGFKDEYNRLMGLFKGENTFESFIKPNQVNSCPRSFSIKISDSIHNNITIDICESLSKVRPALYSIFYIVFFMAFLYLTIKFSLRLFSNPFRVI